MRGLKRLNGWHRLVLVLLLGSLGFTLVVAIRKAQDEFAPWHKAVATELGSPRCVALRIHPVDLEAVPLAVLAGQPDACPNLFWYRAYSRHDATPFSLEAFDREERSRWWGLFFRYWVLTAWPLLIIGAGGLAAGLAIRWIADGFQRMPAAPATPIPTSAPPRQPPSAQSGFMLALLLYMLALAGIGAAVMFSGYSQVLRSNAEITAIQTARSQIQSATQTLSASSTLDSGAINIVPPAVLAYTGVAAGDVPRLPTNYASANSGGATNNDGSAITFGTVTNTSGVRQLDPWGKFYIYCRWVNPVASPALPSLMIISAGRRRMTERRQWIGPSGAPSISRSGPGWQPRGSACRRGLSAPRCGHCIGNAALAFRPCRTGSPPVARCRRTSSSRETSAGPPR